MRSPKQLSLLCVIQWMIVITFVLPVSADVTNWVPWLSMPEPRTNGQAHVMGHFVFVVGGTFVPYSLNNISSGTRTHSPVPYEDRREFISEKKNNKPFPTQPFGNAASRKINRNLFDPLTSKDIPVSSNQILWIDFENVDKWHSLPLDGRTIQPISAKSGSIATDRSIFISYACDILQAEGNALLEVRLPDPIGLISPDVEPGASPKSVVTPATLHQRSPSLILRNAGALGRTKTLGPAPGTNGGKGSSIRDLIPSSEFTLYLFGGRNADSFPIPEVEMFYNGSWSFVATMNLTLSQWTCNCIVTQPATGSDLLILSGCLHCMSGLPSSQTIVFDTSTATFLPTHEEPQDFSNPNFLPNTNGGHGGMLMQFSSSVYEVSGDEGPAINLYDQLLQQQNEILTVDIQQRRTECAQFNSMGYVFCVGGTSYPERVAALPYCDTAQVRPSPEVSFDHVDGVYTVGDDITVFAGRTCGSSVSMFRLAVVPQCDVPLPLVDDVPCGASTTFRTSTLDLRAGEAIQLYLCYSEGSCSAVGADRVPCSTPNLTNDDCRWGPCCWDNSVQECFEYTAPDSTNVGSTYFTNAIAAPLVLLKPPTTPPAPTPWYHSIAFYVGVSVGSLLVGYFLFALIYKARSQQIVVERQELRSSPFTAFGKNYSVVGQIGQGSFGTVFLAERMSDGKNVALKVLPCNDAKQRNLALTEYDIIHHLRHPNLIRVLDLILNWENTSSTGSGTERAMSTSPSRKHPRSGKSAAPRQSASRRAIPDETQVVGKYNTMVNGEPREDDSVISSGEVPLLSNESNKGSSDGGSFAVAPNSDVGSMPGVKAYGSFNQVVNIGSAANVERRDLDFIAKCPRFICIVTDYYPDGDLRDFVLQYGTKSAGNSKRNTSLASGQTLLSSYGSNGSKEASPKKSRDGRAGVKQSPSFVAEDYGSTASNNSVTGGSVIPERLVRSFGHQLCSLLRYMHDRKKPVIHRDLKPENVLMDGERLIVTDFGLAGVQNNEDFASTRAGTLLFAPPEAFAMQSTSAVDMWAVGCILYAVCTRRVLPETAKIMFSDVDDDDFEDTMRVDLAGYSQQLQDLILGFLRKDPQQRLTAQQGLDAVEGMHPLGSSR